MLGFVCFLICILALFVGMEIRSPGAIRAVVEAGTLVWLTASHHVDADICSRLVSLGHPVAACTGA